VAYKEREKGRAVATAASVQGAVYETTLFPLKYNEPKELTLTCFTALKGQADGTLALTLPLTFALPVPHVTIRANALDGALTIKAAGALPQTGAAAAEARLAAATLPSGVTLRAVPAAGAPQVVSAASGERLYFTGCVSKEEIGRCPRFTRQASSTRHGVRRSARRPLCRLLAQCRRPRATCAGATRRP